MDLRIDHVTVAGQSLDSLANALGGVGLAPEYGGTHSNGVTHMSTLAFRDGTYLECISTLEPGTESPWWDAHIRNDAGPCAWCVRVDDAEATADALRERGLAVEGPVEYARERPDGTRLEWDLVFLGDGEPGTLLPFCIADETPREWRVGEPAEETDLGGVETVVLGVRDLDAAAERLGEAFDLAAPEPSESDGLDAEVAHFTDAPVALAEPRGEGWLADRLDAFGPAPCGFLFAADEGVRDRYPVAATEPWDDGEAAWLDADALDGIRGLGLLDRA